MVQKKKWDVVRAENRKAGLLWDKLLSYYFFHGTTEIIVGHHFTRSCVNVIRLESLLQMQNIMPGKYYVPIFSLNWKVNIQSYLFVLLGLRVILSSPCWLLLSDHYFIYVF